MCALLKKLVTQNIIKKKSRNNSEFFYFKTKRVYPNLERQSSSSRLSGSLWFLKRWNLHECSVSCKQEVRPPSWATRKHRAARFPAQKVTLITFSNTPRNSCKWLYMISSGGSNTTCKYEVAASLSPWIALQETLERPGWSTQNLTCRSKGLIVYRDPLQAAQNVVSPSKKLTWSIYHSSICFKL